MTDPIQTTYDKLTTNKLIDPNSYSIDNFRDWVSKDPNSSTSIYKKFTDNKIIDSSTYSSDDFNKWFGSPIQTQSTEPLTHYDPVDKTKLDNLSAVADTEAKKKISAFPLFDAITGVIKRRGLDPVALGEIGGLIVNKVKTGLTFEKQNELKKGIIEGKDDIHAADVDPDTYDKLLHGDKNDKILESIKSTTEEDKQNAALKIFSKHVGITDLVTLNNEDAIQRKKEAQLLPLKVERDIKYEKIRNYENDILIPSLNKERTAIGDPESLKQFEELNRRIKSGDHLNQDEIDYFSQQLDALKDAPNYLKLLDRKEDIAASKDKLEQDYKDVYAMESLKRQKMLEYDKEYKSRSAFQAGLYNLGQIINHVPGALASELYNTYQTYIKQPLTGNTNFEQLVSRDFDSSYWQKSSKELRPTGENIAEVKYNGDTYQVAFDDNGTMSGIYKNDYDANLDNESLNGVISALNEQNPKHETIRKYNKVAAVAQGLDATTDILGTILLTGGEGLILKGLSSAKYTSAIGRVLLNSPRLLEVLPSLAQFSSSYAEQGARDGGITDPTTLAKYAFAGALSESLVSWINPLEGRLVSNTFGGTSSKFTKEALNEIVNNGSKGLLKTVALGVKNLGKGLGENTVKEVAEEEINNVLNFIQNEGFNKHFKTGFDNENPLTWENIRDTAVSTAVATILPALGEARSHKNYDHFVREYMHIGVKSSDVVENMVKEKAKAAEESGNTDLKDRLDNFLVHFNKTKDSSTEFTEGQYKNAPEDIIKSVVQKKYEIATLQDKKDTKSVERIQELNNHIEELSLKAKYNINNDNISPIPSDKVSEVLSKVDEEFANTDLKNIKGSTRDALYDNIMANTLNKVVGTNYKVKDLKSQIDNDRKDFFIKEIKDRIKIQKDKGIALEDIHDNLLGAQDLESFKIPKKARELYIKNAIQDIGREEKEAVEKAHRDTLKKNNELLADVHTKISKGDQLEYNGIQFTYRGSDGTSPIIKTEDGADLPWSNTNNNITYKELNDAINNGEINVIKSSKSPIGTNILTNTNNPVDTPEPNSPGLFEELLRQQGEQKKDKPEPEIHEDMDEDELDSFVEYHNEKASDGSSSYMAFLGKDHIDTTGADGVVTREDIGSDIRNQAHEFLNKDKYKTGTRLEARVNDDDNILMYDPTVPNSVEVTWGSVKARLEKGNLITLSGLSLSYEDLVPIDLYRDGEKIPANVHTTSWVDKNSKGYNSEGEYIKDKEIGNIKRIRKSILEGNTNLMIMDYQYGPYNSSLIKKPIPTDANVIVTDGNKVIAGSTNRDLSQAKLKKGITYIQTREGFVPIQRDRLNDKEIGTLSSFISLVFGKANPELEQEFKDKGIKTTIKKSVEDFISTFIQVEKPAGSSFSAVMKKKSEEYDRRNKKNGTKKTYVGFEINEDKEGFSLLIGKTRANGFFDYYKVNKDGLFMMQDKEFKQVGSDVKSFMEKSLPALLADKIINHVNRKEFLNIEDNKVVSTNYNDYIKSRLITNINFNKIGDEYTPYFQPQISFDIDQKLKETKENKTNTAKSEGKLDDVDFSPEVVSSDKIGKYIEKYTIPGIRSESIRNLANSILGPVYEELISGVNLKEYKNILNKYLDIHKAKLQDQLDLNINESSKNTAKKLIDNWNVIADVAEYTFFNQVKAAEEELGEDNESAVNEYDEDKTLTKDIFRNTSDKLKLFFAFIQKDKDKSLLNMGSEDNNLFRYYHSTNSVWNKIRAVVTIKPGKFVEPIWHKEGGIGLKQLIANSNLEFKQDFIDRVEKYLNTDDNRHLLHELVGSLYNASRKMYLLLDKGDSFEHIDVASENNYIIKKDEWYTNFLNSSNVIATRINIDDDTEPYKLSVDYANNLNNLERLLKDETFIKLKERLTDEQKFDLLFSTLDNLGIILSKSTKDSIRNGDLKVNPFDNSNGSLVHSLLTTLRHTDYTNLKSLFKDNMFTRLASHEMLMTNSDYTDTVFSGDKLIQTKGLVRLYQTRFSKFTSGLLGYLKDHYFSKASYWFGNEDVMDLGEAPPEALREKEQGTGDLGYDTFTKREHLIYRVGIYDKPDPKGGIARGNFLTAPMEDKKNPFIITAPLFKFGRNNIASVDPSKTDGDIIDILIHQLVIPDLLRIQKEEKDKGYNPKNYFLIPQLNNNKLLHNTKFFSSTLFEDDKVEDDKSLKNVKSYFQTLDGINYYDIIRTEVQKHYDEIVANEIKEWEENKIFDKLTGELKNKESVEKYLGLKNYVFNYLIFNANNYVLTGDSAQYFKPVEDKEFSYANVISTLANNQKRQAILNASFTPISDPGVMRVVTAENSKFKTNVEDFLTSFNIDTIKYNEKDGSDAQMLTSASNYFSTLHRLGYMSAKDLKYLNGIVKLQSKDIKETGKVKSKHFIKDSKIEAILKPLKTVVGDYKDEGTRERLQYIKISEFPLIPQITQGFEIDKIRQFIEKNKIDKFTFDSGFKVGSKQSLKIYDENQNLVLPTVGDGFTSTHVSEISELGYGEQTENPQSSDYQTKIGTQQTKLKFANILNEKFTYTNRKGEKVTETGEQLKQRRDSIYDQLFKNKLDQLQKELLNSDGTIKYDQLSKILKEEIRDFDPIYEYSLSEDTIKNKIPLWINPLFSRIQPKLISIVENRVSRTKVKGKAYVQAFSDLFKTTDPLSTNIKFTNDFDGELKAIRDENGNIVSGQIIVPWLFKSKMSKFVDANGYIDITKIPSDLLQATGFRIPTSGHNSITRFQIVGFMPKFMGNVIFVPSDMLVQMGSDLDFDKLYNLFYNLTEVGGDNPRMRDVRDSDAVSTDVFNNVIDNISGSDISKFLEDSSIEDLKLQNELLDIDKIIYLSDNEMLRRENGNPINMDALKQIAKDKEKVQKNKKELYPLSPSHAIDRYLAGRIGKIGVGSFSLDNVFHAALQNTDIHYKVFDENSQRFLPAVASKNKYTLVNLDRIYTSKSLELIAKGEKNLSKLRLVSDVISGYQQAMLDNGKEQLSDILNITNDTISFIRGKIQTGHEEKEIHELLDQPIIQELLKLTRLNSGYYAEFKSQDKLLGELLEKDKEGNLVQSKNNDLLLEFKAYNDLGKALSGIRGVLNVDSSGFGGSGFGPIIKAEDIQKLTTSEIFTNLDRLKYNKDGTPTYQYSAVENSLKAANIFYSDRMLPYKIPSIYTAITSIINRMPQHLTNSSSKKIEVREKIFKDLTKYYYSSFKSIFNIQDLKEERNKLLFTDPVGKKILRLRALNNPKLNNNAFISNLQIESKGTTLIKFLNNQNNNLSSVDMNTSIVELYSNAYPLWDNYTTKDMVVDLYKYAYLVSQEQGPNDFMKFLPLDYIYDNEQIKTLTNKFLDDSTTITNYQDGIRSFVVQFFQHNPKYLPVLDNTTKNKWFDMVDGKYKINDSQFKYYDMFIRNTYDEGRKITTIWYAGDSEGGFNTYRRIDKFSKYSMYDNSLTVPQTPIATKATTTGSISTANKKENIKSFLTNNINIEGIKNKTYYNLLSKILPFVPDEGMFLEDPNLIAKGQYDPSNGLITIRDKYDLETLTHELIHAMTKEMTSWYRNNSGKLSVEQKRILAEIESIYNHIVDDQPKSIKDRINKLREQRQKENKLQTIDPNDTIPYALSSLDEFMAHLAHDNFRDFLKNNYDNPKLSLYQKIRDLFKQLINTIIGNKSVVDAIEHKVFDLITAPKFDSFPNLEDLKDYEEYYPQVKSVTKEGKVNYTFQIQDALLSDKGKEIIKKSKKNNWSLDETLTKLQVPNNEKKLFLDSKGDTIEDKLINFISKYSFTTEINTAKEKPKTEYGTSYYIKDGYFYQKNDEGFFKQLEGRNNPLIEISKEEYEEGQGSNTQHYSDLTVPGGTNGSYIEANIETPMIVPSIQSHAQFKTDNTIGWMRADEKQNYQEKDIDNLIEIMKKSGILEVNCG